MPSLKFIFKKNIWEKYENRPKDLKKKDDKEHQYIWAKTTRNESIRICTNYVNYLTHEKGFASRCSVQKAWKELPNYLDKLAFEHGLNAGTLHNYAVAICRAFDALGDDRQHTFAQLTKDYPQVIDLCSRRGLQKTKSRDGVDALNTEKFEEKFGRNPTDKELLARVTGVRLKKLSEICPNNIKKEADGSYTVYTFRDKGGKNNHAIVSNPLEIEVLQHLMQKAKERADKTGMDYSCTPIVDDNDHNRGTYQEQRRFKMQALYQDCITKQEQNPDYRNQIRKELLRVYRSERGNKLNKDIRRVEYDLIHHVDADNTSCVVAGSKVYFDHTFVMYVSMMANDHYRQQVTLENYLT